MSLSSAVYVDVLAVICCVVLLLLRGDLRFSHPAVIYLAFHVLVLSTRAWAILNGAPGFLNASDHEISRALNVADLALVSITFGWLSSRRGSPDPTSHADSGPWLPFSDRRLWVVSGIAFPIGLFSFLTHARIPGADTPRSDVTTAYQTLAVTWPGLILIVLIYRYGFRWYFSLPLVGYLGLISVQGFGRYRLILPAILLLQIWLDRRGRKWPTMWMLGLLAALAMVFFPLKAVGDLVQQGGSMSAVADEVKTSTSDTLSGRGSDQTILDHLAITLDLTDEHGTLFWGRPYMALFTLPIPRQLWPDKPGLADHIAELSNGSRPLDKIGGVTTLPGDIYLNFGYLGVAIGMFVIGRVSGNAFTWAYKSPFGSIERLAYLLVFASVIQIARDGLISMPVFLLVHQLPLALLVALHLRVGWHPETAQRFGAPPLTLARPAATTIEARNRLRGL